MHILLLTSSYKSEFNTVSALFFRDQALALKNNKMQVGVICPLPISFKAVWQRNSINFTDELYNDDGVYTHVIPFLSIPMWFERSQKIRLSLERVAQVDVLHSFAKLSKRHRYSKPQISSQS